MCVAGLYICVRTLRNYVPALRGVMRPHFRERRAPVLRKDDPVLPGAVLPLTVSFYSLYFPVVMVRLSLYSSNQMERLFCVFSAL